MTLNAFHFRVKKYKERDNRDITGKTKVKLKSRLKQTFFLKYIVKYIQLKWT